MRIGRLMLASVTIFVVALIWNGVLHLVVLRHSRDAVAHLFRSDLPDKLWLSIVLTLGLSVLFVLAYRRFARTGSVGEGASYGACFALLAGLLVDLNQYVLYPIPAAIAFQWFLGGLAEFTLYGVIVSRLCPPAR